MDKLKALEYFVAAVEEGSFARAALRLEISVPAVQKPYSPAVRAGGFVFVFANLLVVPLDPGLGYHELKYQLRHAEVLGTHLAPETEEMIRQAQEDGTHGGSIPPFTASECESPPLLFQ